MATSKKTVLTLSVNVAGQVKKVKINEKSTVSELMKGLNLSGTYIIVATMIKRDKAVSAPVEESFVITDKVQSIVITPAGKNG